MKTSNNRFESIQLWDEAHKNIKVIYMKHIRFYHELKGGLI